MINITFAGSGPLKEKLEEEAQVLANKPFFGFLTQEQLLKKIASADIYIHAADVEIEGISCIEAISCGLVPIISDAEKSAAKQFAVDKRCLFKAGDSESLRARLDYFIEHREELKELSKAYAESGKRYSLHDSVCQAEKMFEKAARLEKWSF